MSETTEVPFRIMPALTDRNKHFWQGGRDGELRFQRCTACATWRHVPREMCANCGSWQWEWAKSSGCGKVFTWTVAARPLHPAFQQDAPYAPVVVEMDEGVRLLSCVVDCPPDELKMDMPVEVVFDEVTPEITLPKFRRVRA